MFHTLVPSSAHKTSTFVSRAYDKPEINELSSVDPRVLMEPILSLHYVAEIPLSLRYTPLKRSFLLTPLRSGFVPLAPVGPPNSVRVSQACHGHVRHKWRFCAEEAQEYETLNEGGNGLLVTPRDDVHSLGITRLKTRTRSSYLNNPKNPT